MRAYTFNGYRVDQWIPCSASCASSWIVRGRSGMLEGLSGLLGAGHGDEAG
jgi:hypothetical protein